MHKKAAPVAKKGAKVQGLYQKPNQPSGTWYWQPKTPKGGGVRPKPVNLKLKGMDQYVAAVLKVNELKQKGDLAAASTRGRVDEMLPLYYAAKASDTIRTQNVRKAVLSCFSLITGNPRCEAIDEEMMMAYRTHLVTVGGKPGAKKPVAGATVTGYLIQVKAFINWLRETGRLGGNPMKQLNKETRIKGTKVHKFHTAEQRDKFIARVKDPHIKLMSLLGYYQGLREMEMLTLKPEACWIAPDGSRGKIAIQDTEITLHDGTIQTWKPKGKRKRELPMHAKVLEHFKKHKMEGPWVIRPDKLTFPTDDKQSKRYDAARTIRQIGLYVNVPHPGVHIWRHTFATLLAMADTPIVTIAALLGDSIQVTEDHYAGFIPSRTNPLDVL